MKTSFTHLFREKWKAIFPFLFFSMMSLGIYAIDSPCGALDSIAEITLTIDCDGSLSIVAKDQSSTGYQFGIVGKGGLGNAFYKTSQSFVHFTTNQNAQDTFFIEECGTQWYGVLPSWGNGTGAGTYSYSGVGKSANYSDIGTPGTATAVPAGITATVSYKINPPSCPDASTTDGSVELTLNLGTAKNCNPTVGITISGAGSPGSIVNFTDGKYTISGLKAGDVINSITFSSTSAGSECVCPVTGPSNIGSLTIPTPSGSTASLACIDKINVSSAIDPATCGVIISLDDVMLGVNDPCSTNDSAEYIIVKDKSGQPITGTYLNSSLQAYATQTGSGYAFSFNAGNFFGQEVVVEVYDRMSGNYCWGTAKIEDKAAPVLTCSNPAADSILCIDFNGDMAESIKSQVMDCSDFDVTVVRRKELTDCEGSVLNRVELVYFATDEHGQRSATCTDTINILRIGKKSSAGNLMFIDSVKLIGPAGFAKDQAAALSCDNFADLDRDGVPDPTIGNGTGFPMLEVTRADGTIDTLPLPALNYDHYNDSLNLAKNTAISYCKIGASYSDIPLGSFNCVSKFMRTWTVAEWSCEGELDTSWQQIIEIVDTIAPVFSDPVEDATVSVNSYSCTKNKQIKMPTGTDNCSDDKDVTVQAVVYNSDWQLIGPDIDDNDYFDFPFGTNYVVYTISDDCNNYAMDTSIVEVIDLTSPVTVCKDALVVGISVDGTVRVPESAFNNGTYDDCTLESTCVVRMDDEIAFDGIADDKGWAKMTDVYGIVSCERGDWYAQFASEREGVLQLHKGDLCQKDVWFCCADNNEGSEDVRVIFRATDKAGNSNECMVVVDLQDKTTPSMICPPDVTVDCELFLPSVDESIMGTFVSIENDPLRDLFGTISAEHEQEPFAVHPDHVIEDFGNDLVDGIYFDNCETPNVFVKIEFENFDQCNTGVIKRTFYVEDNSGNQSPQCTQTIKIESEVSFDASSIVWPVADTLMTSCMLPEDLTTQMFGVPTARDGACMLFGTSYEDQVFRFNNQDNASSESCFKLIRTWSVIDWCGNDTNGKVHVQPFEQVIKVNDPFGPQITCDENMTVETQNCDGDVIELMAMATDDCTEPEEMLWSAQIDTDNNGSFDLDYDDLADMIEISEAGGKSVATLTGTFPVGTHRIQWIVNDKCGNRETCTSTFTISINKAPTPFAVDVSTVLMSSGMVSIWASDLNNKSEGPCGQEGVEVAIVRSGEPFENAGQSLTFTCDDYNARADHKVAVDFYAFIDLGSGNIIRDFTTVFVTLQDNQGACGGGDEGANAFITGSIRTESSDKVPDVAVDLLGANQGASALEATMTDSDGNYAFPAMNMGGAYTIDPISNTDYLNGVTTLDLVLIQRYILGLYELDSEYKVIAADINNDRSVSAIDLVDLRSVILGVTDQFKNNDSWRFIDADYSFVNTADPLRESFTESYEITDLSSDMNINFVGVKVGDMNGSVDAASSLAQSRSRFDIVLDDSKFVGGEIIQVPLRVSKSINTLGIQFTTSFNSSVLQFAGIDAGAINIKSDNIGLQQSTEGKITLSWNAVNGVDISGDEVLMTLNFKAVQTGSLSDVLTINSEVTNAEIYNSNLETMDINVKYNTEANIYADGYELMQNTPNPFAEQTMISFVLPNASDATLSVFDVTGKLIKISTGSFDKGLNSIELNKSELGTSGVLFYTLETEGFTDTKRMVVLK